MKVKAVAYTPDGTDNYAVSAGDATWDGADDCMVIVFATSRAERWAWKVQGMDTSPWSANTSIMLNAGSGGGASDCIKTFTSTGITLGQNVMVNANTFAYIALFVWDDGDGDFEVSTFSTTNADNYAVTHALSTLEMVMAVQAWNSGASTMHARARGASTDAAKKYDATAEAADYIQDLADTATTFKLGLQQNNAGGNAAAWAAFEQATGHCYSDSFTGTGAGSPVTVTLTQSFTPTMVLVIPRSARIAYLKTDAHSGNNSSGFQAVEGTTAIRTISAGSFTVDGSGPLDQSGETYDVFYAMSNPGAGAAGQPYIKRAGGVPFMCGSGGRGVW